MGLFAIGFVVGLIVGVVICVAAGFVIAMRRLYG